MWRKKALMSPSGAQPPLLQDSEQPPPFPSPPSPKAFPLRTLKSYFNTVLSTIWNHQFTSIGNSEALSCLVWLWSNWEFNKESFALKWLAVSLIFSCPNFCWSWQSPYASAGLPPSPGSNNTFPKIHQFWTYKMGTSDCQKGDPRMGHDYDHDQSQEHQGNILEQTCEALWNWRDLWK